MKNPRNPYGGKPPKLCFVVWGGIKIPVSFENGECMTYLIRTLEDGVYLPSGFTGGEPVVPLETVEKEAGRSLKGRFRRIYKQYEES